MIANLPVQTAHTLAFVLGLLALYPEVQRKLHENVLEVTADGRIPVCEGGKQSHIG